MVFHFGGVFFCLWGVFVFALGFFGLFFVVVVIVCVFGIFVVSVGFFCLVFLCDCFFFVVAGLLFCFVFPSVCHIGFFSVLSS